MIDFKNEPQIFQVGHYGFDHFHQLNEHLKPLDIFDTIVMQLNELVKLRNPDKDLNPDEIEAEIKKITQDEPLEKYGNWIFYPWSKRLLHVLPEKEFVEVRTIRNKYKITEEEQEILKQKKIGVVGLSVGQSVSITMAMERIGGQYRIADYDHLELANLNRLRSGIHNIGLQKTEMVSREIYEIDPYFKVKNFNKGITKDNVDEFIGKGEDQLDVIIDECDSVEIKILLREKARALGIPVVMDTSDRGMLDIERFDLDQSMPIFHGMLSEEEINQLKSGQVSKNDKINIVIKILNEETISESLKISLKEIGKTITTWPQLASSVTIGGGATALTVRKILLGEPVKTGRFFIDVDEIILE